MPFYWSFNHKELLESNTQQSKEISTVTHSALQNQARFPKP